MKGEIEVRSISASISACVARTAPRTISSVTGSHRAASFRRASGMSELCRRSAGCASNCIRSEIRKVTEFRPSGDKAVQLRNGRSLLRWQRADETRGELDPACERATAAGLLVDPDEAAHAAPAEDDGLGAGFCQRLGLQFLADPEHEAADFDAAQHIAVQHPAEAAEHRPLADAWSVREGSAHAASQVWIVRHGWAP